MSQTDSPDCRYAAGEGELTLTEVIEKPSVASIYGLLQNGLSSVAISPKYQPVITKDDRDQTSLNPRDELQSMVLEGRIVRTRVQSAKHLKGFLSGIDTSVSRDENSL